MISNENLAFSYIDFFQRLHKNICIFSPLLNKLVKIIKCVPVKRWDAKNAEAKQDLEVQGQLIISDTAAMKTFSEIFKVEAYEGFWPVAAPAHFPSTIPKHHFSHQFLPLINVFAY